METIKRYLSLYVPVTTCTLRCHYCYITHHRLFGGALPNLKFSPETIRKGLSKERMGGTCLINICGGGETLLPEKIVDYIKVLLEEGHYVMIVTNATATKRFKEIAKFPKELFARLFFKFSYHYIELKNKNLFDVFFGNIDKMRKLGCSFTLETTPSDELIPYIDELQQLAIEKVGATCHVTIARDERVNGELPILTNMTNEKFYETWGELNSKLFDYKKTIYGDKRKEFCYAGAWSALINLGTGVMRQCLCSHYNQNIFKDITKPIRFLPIGNNCSFKHCYNGHSYIVLGTIPELNAPTYADVRNKICEDGSEWLKPEMKAFMETKLFDANEEYSDFQKKMVNAEILVRKAKDMPLQMARNIYHKVKK